MLSLASKITKITYKIKNVTCIKKQNLCTILISSPLLALKYTKLKQIWYLVFRFLSFSYQRYNIVHRSCVCSKRYLTRLNTPSKDQAFFWEGAFIKGKVFKYLAVQRGALYVRERVVIRRGIYSMSYGRSLTCWKTFMLIYSLFTHRNVNRINFSISEKKPPCIWHMTFDFALTIT